MSIRSERAPARPRPAPVDPRIEARRVAVQRQAGRRRLRVLLVAAGAFVLAVAGWLVVESPLLDVDHIEVVGASRVAPDALRAATGTNRGAPLLRVDTDGAERAVEELAWIADATVERDLPGTLRVSVREREPAAFARRSDAGPFVVLDASGRVLEEVTEPPVGLPEVAGLTHLAPPGGTVTPASAPAVLAQLAPLLRAAVGAIVVDAQGELSLRLALGPDGPGADEVYLGAPEALGEKVAVAAAVLAHLETRVAYLDVRVPAAPVTGD